MWIVVCGLCIAAACSGGKPAATKLPAGFVVAHDSHLVGAIFGDDESWTAVIDIERDPVGVYEAYAAQARTLGVDLPTSGAHSILGPAGCMPQPPEAKTKLPKRDRCYDTGTVCFVSLAIFKCEVAATGGKHARIAVSISVAWGRETRLMQLRVSTTTGTAPRSAVQSRGRARYAGPIPVARERAPLSTAGRAFGSEHDASNRGRYFTLEPGSRVIADAPEANVAVLALTADARTVLTRYAEQLAGSEDHPAPVILEHLPRGGTYLTFSFSPEGGGGATFTTDASHKYVNVSWSSD